MRLAWTICFPRLQGLGPVTFDLAHSYVPNGFGAYPTVELSCNPAALHRPVDDEGE
jgi:hypothetical protein